MSATPDYKATLRLPQTDFPMKGDLPIKEPKIIRTWEDKKIYQKMSTKNAGKKKFILPDGPPYANGAIHLGHALNKTLKDIIIKYKNLRGFQAVFIPGWDCHGLPIEHKVLKDLQAKKISKTDHEIVQLCRDEAQKWVAVQSKDFRRLGILADWDHPYLTMLPDYEAEEVRELARSFQKGLVYRGVRPVYWNWVLKTALADAEIEYHPHKSPSIYVKFPVTDAATLKKLNSPTKPTSIAIWTTTPWTLPANVAISLHPDFEYGIYDAGSENFVIAKGLKESFEKETGLVLTETFSLKGADLEMGKARHPWLDRDSLLVLGLHVSLEAGTGAVHTAPGHGADDFKVGLKYKLPVINPVDDSGLYTDEVPEYKGINIFKANPMIVQRLQDTGYMIAYKEIEHSYPHCWRSKVPLIFRTTPQWFIGIDLEGSQIRQKTIQAMKDIKFVPPWGEARFHAMIENRPDWCISRQRLWGVPIPVFICVATGETLADSEIMMKVADVIESEGGISAFTANDPSKFISTAQIEKARQASGNLDFGTKGFAHGRDILDVWYDSGICHAAVQKKREGMGFPADLYLEGSDQHRGWFNTSLLSSMCTNGASPFKALLTHGMTLDPQGRKMSKSLGNTVEPQEVSSKSGAEILRLWSASVDYGKDMSCGKNELDRVTETYRRIRNSMKYLLGATSDFDFAKDAIAYENMTPIDKWALSRLAALHRDVTAAYDNYEFYKIYHALNLFFTVDLSATYMDVLKDRLYTWKYNGLPRRASQTVLHYMTDYLVRMMTPILSFLAEEAYGHMKGEKLESVFLLDYPEVPARWFNEDLSRQFENLLKVRSDVQKILEPMRAEKVIGASLEASVTVQAQGEVLRDLQNFKDLREFLIVSNVVVKPGDYVVSAVKADGDKCVRCWVYSTEMSQDPQLPGICPKCVEALT